MNDMKVIVVTFTIMLLLVLVIESGQIVKNQRLQMKQQFHSDFIALVTLFGEDGLNKLFAVRTPKELNRKEIFATGLLLQRFLVAYRMKGAWTTEEWQSVEKDIKAAMKGSELLRSRWEQIKNWYPKDEQKFLDGIMFSVMDEKTK